MISLKQAFSVIPIAFGGASISGEGAGYGFGAISEDESLRLLKNAFEMGIRVFDTAPIYGFGLSEKRMGKAFKQNRDQVFVVSKSGVTWHPNRRVNMSNDPKTTLKMLEQSLRDLNSDYIDLYMIHWPDAKVDIRKPYEVLAKAQLQGKILNIGLCNTNVSDIQKAQQVATVSVVQSELNYFNDQVKSELLPFLQENNTKFMSWGTFDKGVLSGTVTKDRTFSSEDCRSWAPWWKARDNSARMDHAKRLQAIVQKYECTLMQFALAYNLSFKELSLAICGFRSIEQLQQGIEAYKKLPPPAILAEIILADQQTSLKQDLEPVPNT
ncbi:MAG: aldo/keto reductase [Pseudobdellovibrionaceae bacterium]